MAKLRTVDEIRRGDLTYLNVPKSAQVKYVGRGEELQITHVLMAPGWVACEQRDKWRVETNWWRETPTDRYYFELMTPTGALKHVFYDAAAKTWHTQNYTAPQPVHHIEPPVYLEEDEVE
jgi:hypothetical protein